MRILLFQYRPAIRLYKIGRVLQDDGFDVAMCGTRDLFEYYGDQFKYFRVNELIELERLAECYDVLIHGNPNLKWCKVKHPCRICAVGDVDTFRRDNATSLEMERYTFREFDGFIFVSEEQLNGVKTAAEFKLDQEQFRRKSIFIKNGILKDWLPRRKLLYSGNLLHHGKVKYRDLFPVFKEIAKMEYEIHLYPGHLHYPEEYFQDNTDNIILHDRISPFDLVSEFRQYDAGLILFNLSHKTGFRNLDLTLPNKLYEYRAAGLPVITHKFRSMVNYSKNDKGVLLIDCISDIKKVLDDYYQVVSYEQQLDKLKKFMYYIYSPKG